MKKEVRADNGEKDKKYMRKKGLLDPTDVVIDPPFTKRIMAYPNSSKLKSLPIDPYDGTKESIDHF